MPCFDLHSMVFFNNYYEDRNLWLFHVRKTTANVLLVNLQKLCFGLDSWKSPWFTYYCYYLGAILTNCEDNEQSMGSFHALILFTLSSKTHWCVILSFDVFISFRRLGSLLSDHLVNDRHLRKRNREHKELLIACKVCSFSVVSVAHIWIVCCELCCYCDPRQRRFRFRQATLQ